MTSSSGDTLIRPARATDAGSLAEIRTASVGRSGEAGEPNTRLADEEVDFLDRLSIPHGDDYFCFVAEQGSRIVGYLIGGGSRDLDRKAHGEVYELAVEPGSSAKRAGEGLLAAAVAAFDEAAFAGTLFSFPAADGDALAVATGAGLHPIGSHPTVAGHLRCERSLNGGAS